MAVRIISATARKKTTFDMLFFGNFFIVPCDPEALLVKVSANTAFSFKSKGSLSMSPVEIVEHKPNIDIIIK